MMAEGAHLAECLCLPPYSDCTHPPRDCARCLIEANRAAEALRAAARRFVDDMSDAWGGDSQWLTTGARVAEVVACVLREMAADLEADECAHEWLDRPESDTRECLICGIEVAG